MPCHKRYRKAPDTRLQLLAGTTYNHAGDGWLWFAWTHWHPLHCHTWARATNRIAAVNCAGLSLGAPPEAMLHTWHAEHVPACQPYNKAAQQAHNGLYVPPCKATEEPITVLKCQQTREHQAATQCWSYNQTGWPNQHPIGSPIRHFSSSPHNLRCLVMVHTQQPCSLKKI
jgi:hypothetical protein